MSRRRPPESSELVEGVGQRIRQARERLGWTQQLAAQRLGMSVEGYARIERGLVSPSLETFARVCVDMGVAPNMLLDLPSGEAAQGEVVAGPPGEVVRRIMARLPSLDDEALRLVDQAVLYAWRRTSAAANKAG